MKIKLAETFSPKKQSVLLSQVIKESNIQPLETKCFELAESVKMGVIEANEVKYVLVYGVAIKTYQILYLDATFKNLGYDLDLESAQNYTDFLVDPRSIETVEVTFCFS